MSFTIVDQDLGMRRFRGALRVAIFEANLPTLDLSLTLEMNPMTWAPARGQLNVGSCISDIQPGTIPCGKVPVVAAKTEPSSGWMDRTKAALDTRASLPVHLNGVL